VPRTAFVTGIEAWKRCRTAAIDPAQLGHGATTGLFFACVNLARDPARACQDRDLGMG
jgi:hypothetical protein